MGESFFYRASDELAADLRGYAKDAKVHFDEVVEPFRKAHPDNGPVVNSWGRRTIGFADDKRDVDPPKGLSRSQKRTFLIPVRGKAGDEWRKAMDVLQAPWIDLVYRKHDVPTEVIDGNRLYRVNWMDFGTDGVVITIGTEIGEAPALTPMKRSEFYALYEAHQENVRERSN